jgi:hypothetical protein
LDSERPEEKAGEGPVFTRVMGMERMLAQQPAAVYGEAPRT